MHRLCSFVRALRMSMYVLLLPPTTDVKQVSRVIYCQSPDFSTILAWPDKAAAVSIDVGDQYAITRRNDELVREPAKRANVRLEVVIGSLQDELFCGPLLAGLVPADGGQFVPTSVITTSDKRPVVQRSNDVRAAFQLDLANDLEGRLRRAVDNRSWSWWLILNACCHSSFWRS